MVVGDEKKTIASLLGRLRLAEQYLFVQERYGATV